MFKKKFKRCAHAQWLHRCSALGLPFFSPPVSRVPESFGKWVVVNLQLRYLSTDKREGFILNHSSSAQLTLPSRTVHAGKRRVRINTRAGAASVMRAQ